MTVNQMDTDLASGFVRDMIQAGVLKFGDFVLKSGRRSPYFFNLGAIDDGTGLNRLGEAYAAKLRALDAVPEVVFGPAYKGIPIAVATATALARAGINVGVAYNRKETKDHGEGGTLVGADVAGKRVLILDDVMTAGTAVSEAVDLIRDAGGAVAGVLVALDREEVFDGDTTAVQSVAARLGVPVKSIASLNDVLRYLAAEDGYADALETLQGYRRLYCLVTA